jgi:hypothetical protein
LPAQPEGTILHCPSCGAINGSLREVDEYAAAVVAGRSDVAPPSALPVSRLKVRFEPKVAAGYREGGSAGPARGALTITLRYFGVRLSIGLLLAAAAIGGLGYGWYLAWAAKSYLIIAIATIPVALFVWFRVSPALDRLLIRVADGELYARTSQFWPKVQTRLPVERIDQLFVRRDGRAYTLHARTADGADEPLVRQISDPTLAWYFERQLEEALGLSDRHVAGQVFKAGPPPKRIGPIRAVAVQLAFLVIFVLSPIVALRACGAELVEVPVSETPQELRLDVPKPGRIYFTSEVEFVAATYRSRSAIPRSLTVHIQLAKNGQQVAQLTCDPLEVTAWVTSSSNDYVSSFWGPMDDCAAAVPEAGELTLRVWRSRKRGMPELRLEETILAARQR